MKCLALRVRGTVGQWQMKSRRLSCEVVVLQECVTHLPVLKEAHQVRGVRCVHWIGISMDPDFYLLLKTG
eukprot:scaffold137930_cov17-Tisochrysis_lutea.AAC.2